MGLAYFNLNNFREAVNSYKKALELDPGNSEIKQALEAAEKKNLEQPAQASSPDLASLLNNPAINSMAQSFAQNLMENGNGSAPNFSQLMQDPSVQNLLNQRSQEAGGQAIPPGFASMMNNPEIISMAQQAMQNPAIQSMISNLMQNPEALNGLLSNLGSQLGAPPAGRAANPNDSMELENEK